MKILSIIKWKLCVDNKQAETSFSGCRPLRQTVVKTSNWINFQQIFIFYSIFLLLCFCLMTHLWLYLHHHRYPVAKIEMKDLRSFSIKLKLLFFGYKLNWTEISLLPLPMKFLNAFSLVFFAFKSLCFTQFISSCYSGFLCWKSFFFMSHFAFN